MKKNNPAVMNKRILALVAIVVVIEMTINLLGTFIAAPTEAHRKVTRELSQVQTATDEASLKKANDRYQELMNTPEGQYSMRVGIVAAVVQMLVGLGLISALYTRIRKKRLAADPVTATAASYTLATFVGMVLIGLIEPLYLDSGPFMTIPYALSLFWGALVSFVIAYLLASFLHRRYTKRHSFEVE